MEDLKQPYTTIEEDGIYHYPVKADGSMYLAPIRLCDPFEIAGIGIDESGIQYYIIKHDDEHCIIPRGEVGTNEGWRKLRNDINIPSKRLKLDLLTEYIQEHTVAPHWTVTDVAGWHGNAYILPNGDIIGDTDNIYFNGKISYNKRIGYKPKGNLKKWKDNIGRYAEGNSRLCLMLGAAFAAPLLKYLNIDGGILHIYGKSSQGKTTAQRFAQSVWGDSNTGENWNTTAFALMNDAKSRNDGLLSMDEMGEDITGKAVEKSIYALANGKGRSGGMKDGSNRAEIRFRVLGISTGETSLEAHMNKTAGKMAMAGQLVRCPSIPHELESHHHFEDFREFTEYLNNVVSKYYASAGRAFIEKVINDNDFEKRFKKLYEEHFDELKAKAKNGQLSRAAKLFAATMTALSFACDWGITGFSKDIAIDGINQCFQDWLNEQPNGKSYEDNKIVTLTTDFIQTHEPFFQKPEEPCYAIKDFPGYVVYQPPSFGEDEGTYLYYVFQAVFKNRVTQGFDEKKAKETLHDIGWLRKPKTGWVHQLYGKGEDNRRKRLGYFLLFEGVVPPNDTTGDEE